MSFLTSLTSRNSIPLLDQMASFTQARHRVLTENVANIDTPGYRTRQLDPAAFQAALRRAANARQKMTSPLRMHDTEQVRVDKRGRLQVTPELEPADNLLFYDGTNGRIERQMAMLAENAMTHQLTTELLRGKYEGLLTAIRGRIQ